MGGGEFLKTGPQGGLPGDTQDAQLTLNSREATSKLLVQLCL